MTAHREVGPLLRAWRERRHLSQMALALDVGMSTRHLSFVETGRARPSAELLLSMSEHLAVPLRERNDLLLAAGYAPRYAETPLDAPDLQAVRAALERLADGSYGECTGCGQSVGVPRLLAQPSAARCIACQSKAETQTRR